MKHYIVLFAILPRVLWEQQECTTGFEKIIWMSSCYQVAQSEWEPELYLCANSSKFRNVSSGESG